jgi:hypothetical protein
MYFLSYLVRGVPSLDPLAYMLTTLVFVHSSLLMYVHNRVVCTELLSSPARSSCARRVPVSSLWDTISGKSAD